MKEIVEEYNNNIWQWKIILWRKRKVKKMEKVRNLNQKAKVEVREISYRLQNLIITMGLNRLEDDIYINFPNTQHDNKHIFYRWLKI